MNDGVDTTVVAAFAVGFLSFVSPCVLPLVPGYLSTISGVSFADLQAGKGRRKVLGPALLFCLAFSVMFIALGMTATGFGDLLQDNRTLLRKISGVIITLLGLVFIATVAYVIAGPDAVKAKEEASALPKVGGVPQQVPPSTMSGPNQHVGSSGTGRPDQFA